MPDNDSSLILSDSVYKKAKFVAQIVLPAVSTLYFTLGNIWGFPAVENVIGTIAAINVFLGAILGLSTRAYNNSEGKYDGDLVYSIGDSGKLSYLMELNDDPTPLKDKSEILFKVKPKTPVQG